MQCCFHELGWVAAMSSSSQMSMWPHGHSAPPSQQLQEWTRLVVRCPLEQGPLVAWADSADRYSVPWPLLHSITLIFSTGGVEHLCVFISLSRGLPRVTGHSQGITVDRFHTLRLRLCGSLGAGRPVQFQDLDWLWMFQPVWSLVGLWSGQPISPPYYSTDLPLWFGNWTLDVSGRMEECCVLYSAVLGQPCSIPGDGCWVAWTAGDCLWEHGWVADTHWWLYSIGL